MKESEYSSVKEWAVDDSHSMIKEFSADNYDIPHGDIFDPLVQKLIAKRC